MATRTVNQQIDALLKRAKNPAKKTARNPARKTAARSVVLVAAKNPRANKYAPSHRVESSLDKKSWVHYGDFLGKAKASEVAKLLHKSHPDLYIRVVTIK